MWRTTRSSKPFRQILEDWQKKFRQFPKILLKLWKLELNYIYYFYSKFSHWFNSLRLNSLTYEMSSMIVIDRLEKNSKQVTKVVFILGPQNSVKRLRSNHDKYRKTSFSANRKINEEKMYEPLSICEQLRNRTKSKIIGFSKIGLSSSFRETGYFRLCPIPQLFTGRNRKWLAHIFFHLYFCWK